LPLYPREPVILSVGQFRPEKDHPLQIRAFARFLNSSSSSSSSTGKKGIINKKDIKLVLLGSCRGAEDERRVETLRALAAEAGVGGQVEFVVGAPFPELKRWLGRASVGVHTMWNEHFGICVVEYMVRAKREGVVWGERGEERSRRKVQQ
jgi:alpha-1,2-mannosyltransferase